MSKNQAIIESYRMELPLADPVNAEAQAFEMLKLFQEAAPSDKRKIKLGLLKAAKKAQAKGQTFVASIYRQAYRKLDCET